MANDSTKKNHVLFVEPRSSYEFALEVMKKHRLICVAIIIEDNNSDGTSKKAYEGFHDLIRVPSDPHETIKMIKSRYDKDDVLFVLNGADEALPYVEQLAHYYCPEFSNSTLTNQLRSDKHLLNQFLSKKNIPVAQQIVIDKHNQSELDEKLKNFNFPVFAKPKEGHAGSFSVKKTNNIHELKEHVRISLGRVNMHTKQTIKSVLVEEFLHGIEYAIDTVSFKGEHFVTGIFQYEKVMINGIPTYVKIFTISPHSPESKKLSEYTKEILNHCQVLFGANHTEVVITEKGPRLIEVNPRISGAFAGLQKMSDWSFGNSQVALLVQLIERKDKRFFKTKYRPACILFLYPRSNHSDRYLDMSHLKSIGVEVLHISYSDRVIENIQVINTPAIIYLASNSEENIHSDIKTLQRRDKQDVLFLEQKKNLSNGRSGIIIFIAVRLGQINVISDDIILKKVKYTFVCALIAVEDLKGKIPDKFLSLFDTITWIEAEKEDGLFLLLDPLSLRSVILSLIASFPADKCYIFFSGEGNMINVAKATQGLKGIHRIDETKVDLFRNKDKMKEYLNRFDITTPQHIHHFKKIPYNKITSLLGSPFVIKPIDRAGSEGFNLIREKSEYQSFIENTIHIDDYSAESFIDGVLYHVDSVVVNGSITCQALSEYGYPQARALAGLPVYSILIPHPTKVQKSILQENSRVLNAFNVDGNFHAEYFLTPNNKVYFLEIGWRVCGIPCNVNFTQSIGLDQTSCYIGLKTEVIDPSELINDSRHSIQLMLIKKEGVYKGFDLEINPNNYEVLQEIPLGTYCETARNYSEHVAIINIFSDSYDHLYDYFQRIRTMGSIAKFDSRE